MSGSGYDEMQPAIDECDACRDTCVRALSDCLEKGGGHADARHAGALLDCIELCAATTAFMLRTSPLHGRLCGLCADVCDACAASCERFVNDEVMRGCAAECGLCAASCRAMAHIAAHR